MKFASPEMNFAATGFNYDVLLDGIDKDSFEELRKLTSHAKSRNSVNFEKKLQTIVVKMLSKGLSLSILDLSMAKISMENQKPVDGFSIVARTVLKEDANLAKNLRSPQSIVKNFNLASTIKFSKDFYAIINKEAPVTGMANSLAKEDGNNFVFEIKLNDGKFSVNDKAIN